MNTIKKVLCIALVLIMSLSVLVLPVSAADDYSITVELEDQVVGVDANGNKLHRIVAYVDSTHSLYALQLSISYPKAVFYPVNATTLKKLPAPGTNAFDKKSTDIIFNANADVYADYLEDGYYYGDGINEDSGYAYFASDVSPSYAKMGDAALGDTANYAGFYWTYATDFGDNYLLPSGGKSSGLTSPTSGRVAVCAVYLAEVAGAAKGTYEIGVHSTQKTTVSGTYVTTDVLDSLSIGTDMKSITSGVTYKNAVIKIGEEPSIVNPLRDGQIRFHKNGTAYAGSFDVRALAVISGDDFDATFTDIATAKTMISEIGFVFAKGANVTAPSMDAVKALVENGTAAAGYTKKTVNYISTSVDEGNYVFSCIATDIPDAAKNNSLVAVGYIAYTVDGETVYAYYPAAQTISFADLFDAHYADAFGA